MIRQLEVARFKSLKEIHVTLEPLTILIGANASGKTNLLDVIRFLQGVGNGLTVREILDGRMGDATLRRWDGIRGGSQEVLYRSGNDETCRDYLRDWMKDPAQDPWDFSGCLGIKVTLEYPSPAKEPLSTIYTLVVDPALGVIRKERLEASDVRGPDIQMALFNGSTTFHDLGGHVYDTYSEIGEWIEQDFQSPVLRARPHRSNVVNYSCHQPILSQFRGSRAGSETNEKAAIRCANTLADVQFLDVSLTQLRRYAPKGVKRLGDHGENFASVVHAILQQPERKQAYLSWLQELTPTRIEDIELFTTELEDVLFGLREDGTRLSAHSLSDGTLRFAALAVALLGPKPPATLLVEEIENGVHPTRLRLVLELLEQASQFGPQVIVTTHSPLVLAYLSPELYKNVLFVYRSSDDGSTDIKPLPQVPHLMKVLQRRPLDKLFATGWLEEAV